MIYKQTLYSVIPDYVKPNILKKKNKQKSWGYGYNKEHDLVVISRSGEIGEIYNIQGLKIGLPLINRCFKRSNKKQEQYWQKFNYPKELQKIKSVFDWNNYPDNFKEQWHDYIDNEFWVCFRR